LTRGRLPSYIRSMRITEFISRVNLERFLKLQKDDNYYYRRHDYLGWIAYFRNGGEYAGCLLDRTRTHHWPTLYQYVTQQHPECLDTPIVYNKKADEAYRENIHRYELVSNVFDIAQKHMNEFVTHYNIPGLVPFTRRCTLKDWLITRGCKGCPDNGFGSISDSVYQDYPDLTFPKDYYYQRNLLVPSWTAKGILFSLEACHPEAPNERELVYCMDPNIPMGWYGDLNAPVVEDLNHLAIKKGLVWSPHARSFLEHPVVIDPELSPAKCMQLWVTPRIEFARNPAEIIKERGMEDYIKENLYKLSKNQLNTLENNVGTSFQNDWLSLRKECRDIGGKNYQLRSDGYYVTHSPQDIRITDFTLNLLKVVSPFKGKMQLHVEINRDQTCHTVIMTYQNFQKGNFVFKLKEHLMELGIAKAFVHPSYEYMLADIATEFWPELVTRERPEELEKKTPETPEKNSEVAGNQLASATV
jgi:hypothetical protein